MKDEIVDAVLKKSYITKKGHKLRTWKRRWFVLKKTIMRYYESKEKLVLKVANDMIALYITLIELYSLDQSLAHSLPRALALHGKFHMRPLFST